MIINDELIQQWEPKVQKFASNTYIQGFDRDDIVQELRIAIVKAAQGFEEDRGVLFHTYLHTAMNNTIRTLMGRTSRQLKTESLYMTGADYGWGLTTNQENQIPTRILEALIDPYEFTVEVEFQELLDEANLTPLEHQFIKLRLEGLTMEEITEDLGESAYRIRQGVRDKLQEVLEYEQEERTKGGSNS